MHIPGQILTRRRSREFRPAWDRLDERCLLSGLTPAQVTSAYALMQSPLHPRAGSAVKGDGSGETIALIEAYHDPTITSDLKTFDATFGLPNPTLTVVDQAGQAERRRLGTRGIAGRRVGACHRPGGEYSGGGGQLAIAAGSRRPPSTPRGTLRALSRSR